MCLQCCVLLATKLTQTFKLSCARMVSASDSGNITWWISSAITKTNAFLQWLSHHTDTFVLNLIFWWKQDSTCGSGSLHSVNGASPLAFNMRSWLWSSVCAPNRFKSCLETDWLNCFSSCQYFLSETDNLLWTTWLFPPHTVPQQID